MTKMILDGDILRPMNDKELANYETICAERQAEAQVEADKVIARQAVLDKLGLTADEAAALFG